MARSKVSGEFPPSTPAGQAAPPGAAAAEAARLHASDDEFAGIPSPRRRPPWLAALVVLISGYLVAHQARDVLYALSSGTPLALGPASRVFADGASPPPENRYVRLEGTPDFESALVLDTQGEWKFRSFFRVLDTNRKLFVERVAGPLPLELVKRNAFTGRLVRLDAVSFSASIRRYFADHVSSTAVFAPEDVRAALEARRLPGALRDRLGEVVTLAGNDLLTLDVARPQAYLVELPQFRYFELEEARQALARTGAVIEGKGKSVAREGGAGFAFTVVIPRERTDAVVSAIADLAHRVRFEPVIDAIQTRLNTLASADGHLTLTPVASQGPSRGPVVVSWDRVTNVRTTARLEIPEGAYLLLEGERPRHQYRALVATAFLLAFGLVNVFALVRR